MCGGDACLDTHRWVCGCGWVDACLDTHRCVLGGGRLLGYSWVCVGGGSSPGHSWVCVFGWTLVWTLRGVCVCGWTLTWTLTGVCVGGTLACWCVCVCVCVWWGRSCAGLDVARWEEERPRGSEPQGSRRRGSGKERVKVGEEPGATRAGAQDRFRARGGPPCPCPHHLPVPQLPLVLTCVSVLCSFPCTC